MEEVLDYTTEDTLKRLAQANLLIFHGADDINVNYADLVPVHKRLLELNPDIEIHIAEGVGGLSSCRDWCSCLGHRGCNNCGHETATYVMNSLDSSQGLHPERS